MNVFTNSGDGGSDTICLRRFWSGAAAASRSSNGHHLDTSRVAARCTVDVGQRRRRWSASLPSLQFAAYLHGIMLHGPTETIGRTPGLFRRLDPKSGELRGRNLFVRHHAGVLHALGQHERELSVARDGRRSTPADSFWRIPRSVRSSRSTLSEPTKRDERTIEYARKSRRVPRLAVARTDSSRSCCPRACSTSASCPSRETARGSTPAYSFWRIPRSVRSSRLVGSTRSEPTKRDDDALLGIRQKKFASAVPRPTLSGVFLRSVCLVALGRLDLVELASATHARISNTPEESAGQRLAVATRQLRRSCCTLWGSTSASCPSRETAR